jgi:hypothetical protein
MQTTAVLMPADLIRVKRRPSIRGPIVIAVLLALAIVAILANLPRPSLGGTVAPAKHTPVVVHAAHRAPPVDRLTASVAGKTYGCTLAPAKPAKPKH